MKLLSLFTFLLLAACTSRLERQMETWNHRVAEFTPAHGVWEVSMPAAKGYVYPPGSRLGPDSFRPATLLLPDVLLAEYILSIQFPLADMHPSYPSPPVRWKLHGYTRQYQGYRDEAGKLHVWVNAVWKDERRNSGLVLLKDGGNYYWQVWVDASAGRLYDLMINGEA